MSTDTIEAPELSAKAVQAVRAFRLADEAADAGRLACSEARKALDLAESQMLAIRERRETAAAEMHRAIRGG